MLKVAKVLQKGKRKGLNCRVNVSCGEGKWGRMMMVRLSGGSEGCRLPRLFAVSGPLKVFTSHTLVCQQHQFSHSLPQHPVSRISRTASSCNMQSNFHNLIRYVRPFSKLHWHPFWVLLDGLKPFTAAWLRRVGKLVGSDWKACASLHEFCIITEFEFSFIRMGSRYLPPRTTTDTRTNRIFKKDYYEIPRKTCLTQLSFNPTYDPIANESVLLFES